MRLRQAVTSVVASVCFLSPLWGAAQGPKPRLAASLDTGSRAVLQGSRPPRTQAATDQGVLPGGTKLQGITIAFNRSAAQQADLDTLLAAQQDPGSPLYHQWLTPDQFAARFGLADADLEKVQTWLQQQGFTINGVGRGKDRITFSGTAAQVAAAFGTELHRYQADGETHMAPNSDISLPSTLQPLVTGVTHLSDFRPKARLKLGSAVRPAFTSSQTQNHYLTPADVATMYDVSSTYSSGFDGTGQAIAVIGQSYVNMNSIQAFQTAAGQTVKSPNLVLMPNTGVSAYYTSDEGESELDLEYAGGMAPGANLFFVYTGDNPNYGVFDSLQYAVSENIAPVISGSYGTCETGLSSATVQEFTSLAQQANAQGQTILFSSGDDGSTDCYGVSGLTSAQKLALAVDFPGSVPGITSVGGTQMASGTYASGSTTYWKAASGSDVVGSLLSYVPEVVWNEDSSTYGLSSGGGGASALFSRPTWQTGVTGIPTGTTRLVPDISLQASTGSPGFIFCTADSSDLSSEGVTSSCTNGFRNASGTLVVAGGTSFSAPITAGLIAVLNQAKHATGQGNINPTLYSLASNATTYASAFHDITSGSNACTAGSGYCSSTTTTSFAAGTGYDEASGLGTIDFANLLKAWPTGASTANQVASTTTLSAATLTPSSGATDTVTITVASGSTTSTAVPTGTVQIVVDGSSSATTVTLSGGKATYTYPGTTTGGSHVIVATYSGDSNFYASKGTLTLTLAGSAIATGSFTLSATAASLAYNSIGTSTVAVAPASGYSGEVIFTLTSSSTISSFCYSINPVVAYTGVTAQNLSTTLTLGQGTACNGAAARTGAGTLQRIGTTGHAANQGGAPATPWRRPAETTLAGVLLGAVLLPRRRRRLPALLGLALLSAVGLGLSGCGGSSGSTNTGTTTNTTQTYTMTLTGVDSVTSAITSSTTFTMTVHP